MSILSNSAKKNSDKQRVQAAATEVNHEFNNFVSDIENLIKETASLTGDELAQAKIKINQRIASAKQSISSVSSTVAEQARKTASATNEYVHEKPWAAIGTGAVVSFALGLLLSHHYEKSNK